MLSQSHAWHAEMGEARDGKICSAATISAPVERCNRMASGPLVVARNIRFPVYLAAGQILHVAGKADVLDCHLVIQNTEKSWEMRVFHASPDTLRAPHSSGQMAVGFTDISARRWHRPTRQTGQPRSFSEFSSCMFLGAPHICQWRNRTLCATHALQSLDFFAEGLWRLALLVTASFDVVNCPLGLARSDFFRPRIRQSAPTRNSSADVFDGSQLCWEDHRES